MPKRNAKPNQETPQELDLGEHIEEVEKHREKLMAQFRLSVFSTQLARNNLPSLNPLDIYLVAYPSFRERHKKLDFVFSPVKFLVISSVFIGGASWLFDFLGLQALRVSLFVFLIFSFYFIGFFFPLVYWFVSLWRRIQLTIFTDYLKKNILRELLLLRNYYSLLRNFAQRAPEDEVKDLENGIKEMEEFGKSFTRPKFLRNLTLGSLSSVLGTSGLLSTILTRESPITALISFVGPVFAGLPIWAIFVAATVPPIFIPTLVVLPLIGGIRKSANYSDRNFTTVQSPLRKAMREAIPALSVSREEIMRLVPSLEERPSLEETRFERNFRDYREKMGVEKLENQFGRKITQSSFKDWALFLMKELYRDDAFRDKVRAEIRKYLGGLKTDTWTGPVAGETGERWTIKAGKLEKLKWRYKVEEFFLDVTEDKRLKLIMPNKTAKELGKMDLQALYRQYRHFLLDLKIRWDWVEEFMDYEEPEWRKKV